MERSLPPRKSNQQLTTERPGDPYLLAVNSEQEASPFPRRWAPGPAEGAVTGAAPASRTGACGMDTEREED